MKLNDWKFRIDNICGTRINECEIDMTEVTIYATELNTGEEVGLEYNGDINDIPKIKKMLKREFVKCHLPDLKVGDVI